MNQLVTLLACMVMNLPLRQLFLLHISSAQALQISGSFTYKTETKMSFGVFCGLRIQLILSTLYADDGSL